MTDSNERRREIDSFFTDDNLVVDDERTEISPSGRHRLVITTYKTRGWNYSRGRVFRVADGSLVCDIQRNYSRFHHSWLAKGGHEWLVTGRSYMSQTIIDLDAAREYETPGDPYDGGAFCWAQCYLSPDESLLVVDGCIWACPYEYRFFDFTDPANGWAELPVVGGEGWVEVEGEHTPVWHDDGAIEIVATDADDHVIGRTRLRRNGAHMTVVERGVSDDEQKRRAAALAAMEADEQWRDSFRAEDPLYACMHRLADAHDIPGADALHVRKVDGRRRVGCWFRRAAPKASADIEWDVPAGEDGSIRVQRYDAGGARAEELVFACTVEGMRDAMARIARDFG